MKLLGAPYLILIELNMDDIDSISVDMQIINHLKYRCNNWNNIWYSSIYGDPCEDDREYCNTSGDWSHFKRNQLADEPRTIVINDKLLQLNYCAVTANKGHRMFCDNCKESFRKVKYYFDRNELDRLADNWYQGFDESVKLDTIRDIQSHAKFLELNGNVVDSNWKTYKFDSYFDKKLDSYLDILSEYDVIDLGWYFCQSVEPLSRLPKLKGIICGFWFNNDLNVLSESHDIKFISVQRSYNRKLCDAVYNKTYN